MRIGDPVKAVEQNCHRERRDQTSLRDEAHNSTENHLPTSCRTPIDVTVPPTDRLHKELEAPKRHQVDRHKHDEIEGCDLNLRVCIQHVIESGVLWIGDDDALVVHCDLQLKLLLTVQ